ncbi:outer membrane beta-barrel protein [Ornithobacterium rhinotracheale]
MKKLSFLALLCAGALSQAQQQTPFNDYWKVGLGVGTSNYFASNETDQFLKLKNTQTINVGIDWNAYQFDNYNIKTGLYLYISNDKENSKYEAKRKFDKYAIPISIERYFPVGKNYLVVGAGFNNIIGTTGENGEYDESFTLPNGKKGKLHGISKGANFSSSFMLNVGYSIPTNVGLFALNVEGGLGLVTPYKAEIKFDNDSKTYTNKFTNNYIGAGIKFYPKRKNAK